jgi:hypothetical protein
MASKATTKTKTEQQHDHDCARLAREALFPSRLHRDVTHPYNFPALLVLDRYRQELLRSLDQQMTFSKLFPRHVVVVRNLVNENDIQWNGQPDINTTQQGDASFEVVPNRLTVRCTSECDQLLQNRLQRALVQRKGKNEHEIVVCSDRVLQSDYYNQQKHSLDSSSVSSIANSTDLLAPRSLAAVEEVLAHALVVVEQQQQQQASGSKNAAFMQVQAAQAAECYYSRHELDKHHRQVKRGSQLGFTGFSLLPQGIQHWMQRWCMQRVATEHLLVENENGAISRSEAQKAVQEAMKRQCGANDDDDDAS